jgi:hypothetical protein
MKNEEFRIGARILDSKFFIRNSKFIAHAANPHSLNNSPNAPPSPFRGEPPRVLFGVDVESS